MAYDPAKADAICARLANGESLRAICRDVGMNEATFRLWEREHADLHTQSTRARELGCHALADECLEIADDARNDYMTRVSGNGEEQVVANPETVQRSKLRIETRMRLLGKWLPRVYGDKVDMHHSGTINLSGELAGLNDEG